jgi:hypothetical protein
MRRILALLLALALIGCARGAQVGDTVPSPTPIDILASLPTSSPTAQPTAIAETAVVPTATPEALAAMALPTGYPGTEAAPVATMAIEMTPYPEPGGESTRPSALAGALETVRAVTATPTSADTYPGPATTLPAGGPTSPASADTYPGPATTLPAGGAATTSPPTSTPRPTLTPQPRVPNTPTPQPTALTRPRDAGPEGRTSNIGPYLLMNPEVGQPTHNLLKDGRMRAYMAINPAHWGDTDRLPNMEGYGRNWIPEQEELDYIRAGAEGARRYFDRFHGTYEQMRGEVHAWMSTWAFRFGDAAFAAQWVDFQREWLRLMREHDYRAGVGGMKTYLFGTGEIVRLAPAIAEADYFFLAESGAPTLRGSFGQTTLLYRNLVRDLLTVLPAERIPPLILDVCVDGKVNKDLGRTGIWWQRGYRDFETSPADYAADVRAYDLETLKDPYVKHVFWFATNISTDTRSFDVNTDMLAIANGWHAAP